MKPFNSKIGKDVKDSFCAPVGPKGDKGAQGAKGDKGQAASSGVKYVRWGKTSCPSGARIVYKGTKKKGDDLPFILFISHTSKFTRQQTLKRIDDTVSVFFLFQPFSNSNLERRHA